MAEAPGRTFSAGAFPDSISGTVTFNDAPLAAATVPNFLTNTKRLRYSESSVGYTLAVRWRFWAGDNLKSFYPFPGRCDSNHIAL